LNCPHCGSELEYEDATFCPNCGESLTAEDETQQEVIETQHKQTDLKLAAAILTMISATFVASLGYLGVYQYFALIDYYGPSIASEVVGFLIFGVDGLIAAAFALAGAFLILKKKWFTFSMIGTIFPLASVFVTFLCIHQYNYGFTDILIFAEVAIAMLSLMGILLNFVSRKEYT
jgi:hypothetical protein